MSTVRRRVLRSAHAPVLNPPANSTVATARQSRRQSKLLKSKAALKRWITRLKRATNTVAQLHQTIIRLEANLSD